MRIEFKPSFEKSMKYFVVAKQQSIKEVVMTTIDILSQQKTMLHGIGLKRLKDDYWEVRQGLKVRVLFKFQKGLVEFILVGDHEDVRRFLKHC